MTTIRDMILSDLRAIGAEGVVEAGRTVRTEDIGLGEYWPGPTARPAFRDDDGYLVPLPDGWEVIDKGRLRMQGTGVVRIVCIRHGGVWWLPRCGFYPTAPAAWRAAEQWIKEQVE